MMNSPLQPSGASIRGARAFYDVKQADLAKHAGVDVAVLIAIEKDRVPVTDEMIAAWIARIEELARRKP